MKAEILKDWEHIKAPISSNGKRVFKKGEVVEVNFAEYVSGIENGYILDPDNPPVKKPKKEKSSSKANKETR